jgi:hypothetical protein
LGYTKKIDSRLAMVKSIIKQIFPRPLLKQIFLVLNKAKIRTWDKVFFKENFITKEQFLINEESNLFLSYGVPIGKFSKEVQNKLQLWLNPGWCVDQYLLHFNESAFLEPRQGWAVTTSHRLVYNSLGFSRAPYVHKPRWIETYIYKKTVIRISRIISLRDPGEENYFHFYNDVLPKLFFIKDNSFDLHNFTIVISKTLFDKEYFQFFLNNSWLKELNFYIQDDEWIFFDEAIFCKPYTHTKKYFEIAISLIPPTSPTNKSRRIFLTRPKHSLRFIENMDEIRHLLDFHEFEVIDSAVMKVAQQIEMFSGCKYLISVHGAGIINTIFRQGNPLNILEIVHPSEFIPFHYIMLAHIYGYHYNIILGEKGKLKKLGGFRVELGQFRKSIEDMLTNTI